MSGGSNQKSGADENRIRIGIDLGGTKIEGVALGPSGSELVSRRIAAPRGDYGKTIAAVADLVGVLMVQGSSCSIYGSNRTAATFSVGVGMPGSISPATGCVQNANSTWLNGRSLKQDLEGALKRPVRLANDANCFAISEAVDGAGIGAQSVFGVILGTGVGGGIVISGRIVDGPRGTGGEWGHNPLPWASQEEMPGPLCWCGRRGCMEAWVSGPAMSRDHKAETGTEATAEQIAELALARDGDAQATLARHCGRLARGLAHVINILDPELIVLGGGLSKLGHLYHDLPAQISPHLFTDTGNVRILPPRWGDAGGVRGAAWLWD